MERLNATSLVQIISALLIVNFHTGKLDVPLLNYVAKLGFVFNTVFVFLSGYLLARSATTNPTGNVREFIYRRVNKLYPSYHISLIFIALLYWFIGREITISSSLLAITGFQYYLGDNAFGVHLWFISVILVCYLLFLPTHRVVQSYPIAFLLSITVIFLIVVIIRDGSMAGIYDKTSDDVIYRFIYHYIVFSLAIFIERKSKEVKVFSGKVAIFLLAFSFPAYWWFHGNEQFSVFALGFVILLALSFVSLIHSVYPFVRDHFPQLLILSSVTYELYLVHFSVIDAIDKTYHGTLVSYPAVFTLSLVLAFVVSALSKPYARLTSRCTGWLLR